MNASQKVDVAFDRNTGLYYFIGENPRCFCYGQEVMDDTAMYIVSHPKRSHSYGSLWCHRCLKNANKKNNRVLIACELFMIQICEVVPETAFPVPIMRMSVKNAEVSVFDVAESNKGVMSDTSSCTVIDRTRLACRQSWEGSQVGLPPPVQNPNATLVSSLWADDKKLPETKHVDESLLEWRRG